MKINGNLEERKNLFRKSWYSTVRYIFISMPAIRDAPQEVVLIHQKVSFLCIPLLWFYHHGDLLYMTHQYRYILYRYSMYVCLYRSYYCMLLIRPKPGFNTAWYQCCKMTAQKMHRLVIMMVVILVNKSRLQLHLQYMFFSRKKMNIFIYYVYIHTYIYQ